MYRIRTLSSINYQERFKVDIWVFIKVTSLSHLVGYTDVSLRDVSSITQFNPSCTVFPFSCVDIIILTLSSPFLTLKFFLTSTFESIDESSFTSNKVEYITCCELSNVYKVYEMEY